MDSLLTLEPSAKQDWKIRVRVYRKWRHIRVNGQTAGINMIFVDENVRRIHARMNSTIMLRLGSLLVEGDVFNIENFIVRRYRAHERNQCFKDDKRIFLTDSTIINLFSGPHEFIPKHVFDCIPLNTVVQHAWQDTYLIDVCGIVTDLEPIHQFVSIRGEEQIFVRFVLAGKNNNIVKATMWNELALFMHMSLANRTQRPLIVIIASCKAIIWQGSPTVVNMQATRIFVNSSHPESVTVRVELFQSMPLKRNIDSTIPIHPDVVGILHSVMPITHVIQRSSYRKDIIRFVIKDNKTRTQSFATYNFEYTIVMDSLANLRPIPKQDWKVRVRVSRFWRRILGNDEINGIGFIVVDENGFRMLGRIKTGLVPRLEHEFEEGRIIDIVNFVVRPYTEHHCYRCFLDDKYMFLTSITTVRPVEEAVPNFPMHIFCCTPLNQIIDYNDHETYLIDVLGFVLNVEPIGRFINKNGVEQTFLKFVLSSNDDSSASVKLWNNFANSFLEHIEGIAGQPMSVMISSCKVIFHQGLKKFVVV
ncbi:hypothetical protein DCAR_0623441 [Daucus carota subsp. sativus]|uniref:Replication protein A 70 kDa DNA-binding subunit B/D first OB fold domain-containing protein n=1 Tax=Daucus carota subsp. sativus TaxID=79200 RepID=A0A175YCI9_DAUCS|nr:hypothetical protein DCAR_0623441 [Daucus carota subsp. sativus]